MFRRALCLLVLTAAAFAQSDGREPALPRFNAKSLTGETYNNATLKGKVVLLQFLDHMVSVLPRRTTAGR